MVNSVKKKDFHAIKGEEKPIQEVVKASFERFCEKEDRHRGRDFDIVDSALSKVGKLGGVTVVDVGCGAGEYLQHLHEKYPDVSIIGVDFALGPLKKAQKLGAGGFDLVRADALKIPLGDSSASLVTCMNTTLGNVLGAGTDFKSSILNAPESRKTVLKEMNRILAPGGYAVISVYERGKEHYMEYGWKIHQDSVPERGDWRILKERQGLDFYSHWFSAEELKDLLKSTNFELVEMRERDSRLIAVARKSGM